MRALLESEGSKTFAGVDESRVSETETVKGEDTDSLTLWSGFNVLARTYFSVYNLKDSALRFG